MLTKIKSLLRQHQQKIYFLAIGATNTVIDFGLLFVFKTILHLIPIISNILSTTISMIFSFFMNKKFTFSDDSKSAKQAILFIVVTLFGLWVIQSGIIYVIDVTTLHVIENENIRLFVAKILATVVTLVWNFVMYKKVVFKK